jgi:AraC-like DNA-binding protein
VERVGRAQRTVHAGQLIWHLPGVAHELVEASSDLDLRVVQLEPDLVLDEPKRFERRDVELAPHPFAGWVRTLGLLAAGRPVIELKRADLDRLREDCEQTSHDTQGRECVGPALRRLVRHAWRATRDEHESLRPNSLVELACCELLERPELDRPALCRHLDVSEGYLSRSFQEELGLSFLEQRSRLRLIRFVSHVTRERRSLLDSALLAGFGSYSQLHRVFTHVVGMGPRQYLSRTGRNERGAVSLRSLTEPRCSADC